MILHAFLRSRERLYGDMCTHVCMCECVYAYSYITNYS